MVSEAEDLSRTNSTTKSTETVEGFPAAVRFPMYLVFTATVLISYVIYALIFIVVAKNKDFHTSGYTLVVSLGIAEICAGFFAFPLPIFYGMFEDYKFTKSEKETFGYMIGLTYTVVQLHYILVACNRYVAVKHYNKYKIWFSRKRTIIYILIVYFVYVPSLNMPFFMEWCCYTFIPEWLTAGYNFGCPGSYIAMRIYQGVAAIVFALQVFFYGSLIRGMKKSKQAIRSTNTATVMDKDEWRLTIQFTLVTLVFIASWIFLSISWEIKKLNMSRVGEIAFNAVVLTWWVLNYTINPYVYMFINRRLRFSVHKLLCSAEGEYQESMDLTATSMSAQQVAGIRPDISS